MSLATAFQDWLDNWRHRLREWRHNPCLMRPVTALILLGIALFWAVSMVFKFPVFVLSLMLSWSLNRFSFIVEFLYPTSLGRWIHITLAKTMTGSNDSNDNKSNHRLHSRTLETRIQVTEAVFIHPLPQFLDNLGYLVVCLPDVTKNEPMAVKGAAADLAVPSAPPPTADDKEEPILAFVVDCGDAEAVLQLIESISRMHYGGRMIQIQSILSTHKHHDHTAGNFALKKALTTIEHIFGGAVENVPGCNFSLANGDVLPLPQSSTVRMDDHVQVEAIATPSHTRGSLVYCLRSEHTVVLFTGDAVFSGGSGVAFESDGDQHQDDLARRNKAASPSTFINANASEYAVERCVAELLARSVRDETENFGTDRIVLLPGHEYSKELLARQLSSQAGENCRWRNLAPSAFFETVSQLYVALHRRSLPLSTGNLLVAPTTLRRELLINPVFRGLRKRGEIVLSAIQFWHRHFAQNKVPETYKRDNKAEVDATLKNGQRSTKLGSQFSQWNLDADDIDRPVFTTLFSDDLVDTIRDLKSGNMTTDEAAKRLEDMQRKLESPPIGRRPLPNTLLTERTVYKSLVALILLGSPPAAMTLNDSRKMKVPAPAVSSSDHIKISQSRLVKVLHWLGLLHSQMDGELVQAIMHQLWKEASVHSDEMAGLDLLLSENGGMVKQIAEADVEMTGVVDEVELGSLKWILFGVPKRPPGCLIRWCMPCSPPVAKSSHPIDFTRMHAHSGELVRHDPLSCLICKSATGCAEGISDLSLAGNSFDRPIMLHRSTPSPDDEELSSIEVSSTVLDDFLVRL